MPAAAYASILQQNVAELGITLVAIVFFYPRILGIFLFGLWVWRAGIIRDLALRTALLRRCQIHGLWVGLVFNAATVALTEIYHPNPMTPSMAGFVANLTGSIGVPAGSLFYASTLALLWQSPVWRRRLMPFGARRADGAYQLLTSERRVHDAVLQLGRRALRNGWPAGRPGHHAADLRGAGHPDDAVPEALPEPDRWSGCGGG